MINKKKPASGKIQGIFTTSKGESLTATGYTTHKLNLETPEKVHQTKKKTWWSRIEIYPVSKTGKRKCLVWTPAPESKIFSEVAAICEIPPHNSPQEIILGALKKTEHKLKGYAFVQWIRGQIKKKYGGLGEELSFQKKLKNLAAEWPLTQEESQRFIAKELGLFTEYKKSHFLS